MSFPEFLRVAVVPKPGIFDLKNVSNCLTVEGGSEAEVLDILSQAIPFRYKILLPKEPIWGDRMENGYWTGAIGMVHRNEADIAIGKISITKERSSILNYSYPYYIEDLAFATSFPGLAPKYAAIIFPFTWSLWIAIIVMILLLIVLFRLTLSKRPGTEIHVFGTLVNQQINVSSYTDLDKTLTCGWFIGSLVLSMGYKTVLLAFLTVPEERWVPKNVHELANEVCEGRYRCFTFEGDSHAQTFLKSRDYYVRCMGKKIQENEWRVPPFPDPVAKQLGDGSTAMVAPKFFFQNIMAHKTQVAESALDSLTRVIFFRKDFCCKSVVDEYIHRMNCGGFYERYLNFQLHKANFRHSSHINIDDHIKSLTVTDVSCVFLILLAGYVVSGIIFCFELLRERKACVSTG